MENNNKNNSVIILGVSLAIGLIISAYLLAGALVKAKSNQAIAVKGLAQKQIISDLGIWSCNLEVTNMNATVAYDMLQKDIARVREFLVAKGIKPEHIAVSAVNNLKDYVISANGVRTNEIRGYVLTCVVGVQSDDVSLIDRIYSESTNLIRDGINITSNPPSYFYTKINDLKIETLGAAAADAKLRAEQLAKSTGSRIGTIKSASQGVFQITEPNSTEVSDYGENNTNSIKKNVTAVVTIEFFVQ